MFEPVANTVPLITFTIDNVKYRAEEGMTWGEWVNSKYNIDGYLIYNNIIVNSSISRNVYTHATGSVFSYEIIKYATYYGDVFSDTGAGGIV